ncbi:maleylpyruvate isomerase N-terminal domain-containing protein [Actinacidiphila soli]|uniref:maleylpyruvate isomerase N-terminal domain-containing protein n=1 Tax=Actinacidiphila soli TaxID=2487275 RepID=UPI0013E3A2F6|nr:maleylpyruvate isomerase N-terminal domain-containing protein [Actinacidiphila soli]
MSAYAARATSLDGLKLLTDSHGYLRTVVLGVPEERWGEPSPCSEWTARQVLNHARLDQQAYGAAITGEGMPTSNPFQPEDALGSGSFAELDAVLASVAAAWASVPADAEKVSTPLDPLLGPLPHWLGAGAAALDAGLHAWVRDPVGDRREMYGERFGEGQVVLARGYSDV